MASVLFVGSAAAKMDNHTESLKQQRFQVVSQYFKALHTHDSQLMSTLFAADGRVISTSQGDLPANDFFNSFLPQLSYANVEVIEVYQSQRPTNHYAGSMRIDWQSVTGESGGGRYTDEFIFVPGTFKLKTVIMYENHYA